MTITFFAAELPGCPNDNTTATLSGMAFREASINDFGMLAAYVLPGFTVLWGGTYLSATLKTWLGTAPADAPTVVGFLFVTAASVAVGMTVSTVRWLLVDTVHHATGVRPPPWDFALLRESVTAYGFLIDIHYRYYQFNANMLVALVLAYAARRLSLGFWSAPLGWTDVGVLLLACVFFLGSRDTLRKYYARTGQLLRSKRSATPKARAV